MPAIKTHDQVAWDDFSGGEYGSLHSRYAKPNQFHAKNMLVYRDGTLGPRAGLRLHTLAAGANYVNGALNSFFEGIANVLNVPRMYFSQANTPRNFPSNYSGSGVTVGVFGPGTPQTFDTTPTLAPGVLQRLGYLTYYGLVGDKTYQIDAQTDLMVDVAATSGARDLIEYQDQLYALGIGTSATANRVAYSDHALPLSWPAANYFDVGYAWPVLAGFKFDNGLLMVTQAGRWWLLQGTPEDGSLRSVAQGRGPANTSSKAAIEDRGLVWFIAQGTLSGWPAYFDGSKLETAELAHLQWLSGSESIGSAVIPGDDDLVFVGGTTHRAMYRHLGIWTYHTYEVDASQWIANTTDLLMIAVDGGVSTKPTFFRTKLSIERPSFTSDEESRPGDNTDVPFDAFVEFPEVWQPDGANMRPGHVLVEFTSYETGSATNNNLTVEVSLINRYRTEVVQTTTVGTWNESQLTIAESTSGTRRTFIYRPEATSFAPGLQVAIRAIRGVKIERVVLDFEIAQSLDRA